MTAKRRHIHCDCTVDVALPYSRGKGQERCTHCRFRYNINGLQILVATTYRIGFGRPNERRQEAVLSNPSNRQFSVCWIFRWRASRRTPRCSATCAIRRSPRSLPLSWTRLSFARLRRARGCCCTSATSAGGGDTIPRWRRCCTPSSWSYRSPRGGLSTTTSSQSTAAGSATRG